MVFAVVFVPTFGGCASGQAVRTKYEVTAEYAPEHQTLTGAVKVTFQNPTENELTELKFQLYTGAYRENALYAPVYTAYQALAYYDGKSYGETKISSVNGAKSWQVAGEDGNILSVTPVKSLFPGESVVLDIGFTVTLPKINHRFGVAQNAVHLGRFFPVLCGLKNGAFAEVTVTALGSPFYTDSADYKIALTVPKEYQTLGSGAVETARTLESKTEYVCTGEGIRNFGLALYEKRELLQASVGGCKLIYAYTKDKDAQKTLEVIREAFAYFQKRFGAYPYPVFTVLETAYAGVSDGYTAFVMLSDAVTGEARTRGLVQELAKQWFGEAVGVDRIHNAWLYEGFAEYLALNFFEAHTGYGIRQEKAVADCVKEYRSYYDIYGNVLDRTDTKMTKSLLEYANEYEYRCLSKDKAVIMLDTLQKSIGEKRLTAGLKRYYEKYVFSQTGVAELIGALEHHGADVQGFFDGFLDGKVIL